MARDKKVTPAVYQEFLLYFFVGLSITCTVRLKIQSHQILHFVLGSGKLNQYFCKTAYGLQIVIFLIL